MTDGNGYDFHLKSFATPELFLPLFTQPNVSSGPKASVIIGPNGSNKSRVLALIMDELNNVEEIRRAAIEKFPNSRRVKSSGFKQGSLFDDEANFSNLDKNKKQMIPSFDAQIEYRMDGFDWIVERYGERLKVWRNKESFESFNFSFPDRAIAVAHLPTDRFTFKLNHRDDFYVYLGLRQNYNMTTTGALETKVAVGFLESMKRMRAADIFQRWFAELGLSAAIKVQISVERRRLFEVETEEEFQTATLDHYQRMMGSRRNLTDERQKELIEDIARLWKFVSELITFPLVPQNDRRRKNAKAYQISFDMQNWPQIFEHSDIEEMVTLGRKLRIFSDISMVVTKESQELRFSELSSGEQQVLGTIIRFVAELGSCSVVVIDEPEVSLHPVWQKMYLPRLLETLEVFPNTHAIIATHSHFMVSDVSDEVASLTIAVPDQKGLFETFEGDVYGRSSENILYRVFGIGSTTNYYVERDLAAALRMISGVDDFNKDDLRSLHKRLMVVSARDNPAFSEILSRIEAVLDRESS